MKPEAWATAGPGSAATVTHHFSDRKYVSVEDDVIYLQRVGGRWLLAKPSATLYRAVGYASRRSGRSTTRGRQAEAAG